MIVTGASTEDVALIVRAVSETKYDGNVEIREISDKSSSRTVRTSFTLRVRDGHAGSKGAKGSSGYESSGTGPNGLRCSSLVACWHVHYDVLETLFRHHPQAKVSTALAKYSAADFHLKAIETAGVNVGSRAQPHYPTDLCECVHHTDGETERVILDAHPARDTRVYAQPLREYETYPPDSELGKYASDGAYEDDLLTCPDCGCSSNL